MHFVAVVHFACFIVRMFPITINLDDDTSFSKFRISLLLLVWCVCFSSLNASSFTLCCQPTCLSSLALTRNGALTKDRKARGSFHKDDEQSFKRHAIFSLEKLRFKNQWEEAFGRNDRFYYESSKALLRWVGCHWAIFGGLAACLCRWWFHLWRSQTGMHWRNLCFAQGARHPCWSLEREIGGGRWGQDCGMFENPSQADTILSYISALGASVSKSHCWRETKQRMPWIVGQNESDSWKR